MFITTLWTISCIIKTNKYSIFSGWGYHLIHLTLWRVTGWRSMQILLVYIHTIWIVTITHAYDGYKYTYNKQDDWKYGVVNYNVYTSVTTALSQITAGLVKKPDSLVAGVHNKTHSIVLHAPSASIRIYCQHHRL